MTTVRPRPMMGKGTYDERRRASQRSPSTFRAAPQPQPHLQPNDDPNNHDNDNNNNNDDDAEQTDEEPWDQRIDSQSSMEESRSASRRRHAQWMEQQRHHANDDNDNDDNDDHHKNNGDESSSSNSSHHSRQQEDEEEEDDEVKVNDKVEEEEEEEESLEDGDLPSLSPASSRSGGRSPALIQSRQSPALIQSRRSPALARRSPPPSSSPSQALNEHKDDDDDDDDNDDDDDDDGDGDDDDGDDHDEEEVEEEEEEPSTTPRRRRRRGPSSPRSSSRSSSSQTNQPPTLPKGANNANGNAKPIVAVAQLDDKGRHFWGQLETNASSDDNQSTTTPQSQHHPDDGDSVQGDEEEDEDEEDASLSQLDYHQATIAVHDQRHYARQPSSHPDDEEEESGSEQQTDSLADSTFCGQTLNALTDLCGYHNSSKKQQEQQQQQQQQQSSAPQPASHRVSPRTASPTYAVTSALSRTPPPVDDYASFSPQRQPPQAHARGGHDDDDDDDDDKPDPPGTQWRRQQQQQQELEEQTAIEVEFVDPLLREAQQEAAVQRKHALLAAMARQAKADFESSQQQSQQQQPQSSSHSDSALAAPQYYSSSYGTMTASEKRKFLKWINEGIPAAQASQRIVQEREQRLERQQEEISVQAAHDEQQRNRLAHRQNDDDHVDHEDDNDHDNDHPSSTSQPTPTKKKHQQQQQQQQQQQLRDKEESTSSIGSGSIQGSNNKLRRGLALFWKKTSSRLGRSFDSASPTMTATTTNNNNRQEEDQDHERQLTLRRTRSTPTSGMSRPSGRSSKSLLQHQQQQQQQHQQQQQQQQQQQELPEQPPRSPNTSMIHGVVEEEDEVSATASTPTRKKQQHRHQPSFQIRPREVVEHAADYPRVHSPRIRALSPPQHDTPATTSSSVIMTAAQQDEDDEEEPPALVLKKRGHVYYDGEEGPDSEDNEDEDEDEGAGDGKKRHSSSPSIQKQGSHRSSLGSAASPEQKGFAALDDNDDDDDYDDDDDEQDDDNRRLEPRLQQQQPERRSMSAPHPSQVGTRVIQPDDKDKEEESRQPPSSQSLRKPKILQRPRPRAMSTLRAGGRRDAIQSSTSSSSSVGSATPFRFLGRSRKANMEEAAAEASASSSHQPPTTREAMQDANLLSKKSRRKLKVELDMEEFVKLQQQRQQQEQQQEQQQRSDDEEKQTRMSSSKEGVLVPQSSGSSSVSTLPAAPTPPKPDKVNEITKTTTTTSLHAEPPVVQQSSSSIPAEGSHDEPGEIRMSSPPQQRIQDKDEHDDNNDDDHHDNDHHDNDHHDDNNDHHDHGHEEKDKPAENEGATERVDGVVSFDQTDLEDDMDNYLNSTDIYSVIHASTGSVAGGGGVGDDTKSVYTTGSAFTSVYSQGGTRTRKKRRPGAAKSRLARAKEASASKAGKNNNNNKTHAMGWHESIQAAAASANRKWESRSGFRDYHAPQESHDTVQLGDHGDERVSNQKIHLDLARKIPAPKPKTPPPTKSLARSLNGASTQRQPQAAETEEVPESKRAETDSNENDDVIPDQSEEDLLLKAISSPTTQIRRSRPRWKSTKSPGKQRSSGASQTTTENRPRGWIESMKAASVVLNEAGQTWNPETGWKHPLPPETEVYDDVADFGSAEESVSPPPKKESKPAQSEETAQSALPVLVEESVGEEDDSVGVQSRSHLLDNVEDSQSMASSLPPPPPPPSHEAPPTIPEHSALEEESQSMTSSLPPPPPPPSPPGVAAPNTSLETLSVLDDSQSMLSSVPPSPPRHPPPSSPKYRELGPTTSTTTATSQTSSRPSASRNNEPRGWQKSMKVADEILEDEAWNPDTDTPTSQTKEAEANAKAPPSHYLPGQSPSSVEDSPDVMVESREMESSTLANAESSASPPDSPSKVPVILPPPRAPPKRSQARKSGAIRSKMRFTSPKRDGDQPRGWLESMKAASAVLNQEGQAWNPETGWKNPADTKDKETTDKTTLAIQAPTGQQTPEQVSANAELHKEHDSKSSPKPEADESAEVPDGVQGTSYDEETLDTRVDTSTIAGERSPETTTTRNYVQLGDNGSLHMHAKSRGEEGTADKKIMFSDSGALYVPGNYENGSSKATSKTRLSLGETGSLHLKERSNQGVKDFKAPNASFKDISLLSTTKSTVVPNIKRDLTGAESKNKDATNDDESDKESDSENDEEELLIPSSSFPSVGETSGATKVDVVREKVGEEDKDLFPEQEKRPKKSPAKKLSRSLREFEKVGVASSPRGGPIDLDDDDDDDDVAIESARLSGPVDLDEAHDEWISASENDGNSTAWDSRSGFSSNSLSRANNKVVPKLRANKRDTSPISVRSGRPRMDDGSFSPRESPREQGQAASEQGTISRRQLSKSPGTTGYHDIRRASPDQSHGPNGTLRSSPVPHHPEEPYEEGMETADILRELEQEDSTSRLGSVPSRRSKRDPRELLRQLSKSPISQVASYGSRQHSQQRATPEPEQVDRTQGSDQNSKKSDSNSDNSWGRRPDEKKESKVNEEEDSLFSFEASSVQSPNQRVLNPRLLKGGSVASSHSATMTYREEEQHRDDRLADRLWDKKVRDRRSTGRLDDDVLEEKMRQRREETVSDHRSNGDEDEHLEEEDEDHRGRDKYVRYLASRPTNNYRNDRDRSSDVDEGDEEEDRAVQSRDKYARDYRSDRPLEKKPQQLESSEDNLSEILGHVPSVPSEIYGSDGYGQCEDRTFLQRLTECAAPVVGISSRLGELPSAHLAFLREHPTSAPSKQGSGSVKFSSSFCGRPENIVEEEEDEEEEEEQRANAQRLTQHSLELKESVSSALSGAQDNTSPKRSGSVVSDDYGVKTKYLESIAMRTAVSSKRRRRKSSATGRSGDAASTVSTASSNHSEKWKAFLERKRTGGTGSGVTSSRSSHATDVSKAAERYAALKVQEMMKADSNYGRAKSAPRAGRNYDYSKDDPLRNSLSGDAHDLAHARFEAIETAMATSKSRDESRIIDEI